MQYFLSICDLLTCLQTDHLKFGFIWIIICLLLPVFLINYDENMSFPQ